MCDLTGIATKEDIVSMSQDIQHYITIASIEPRLIIKTGQNL